MKGICERICDNLKWKLKNVIPKLQKHCSQCVCGTTLKT